MTKLEWHYNLLIMNGSLSANTSASAVARHRAAPHANGARRAFKGRVIPRAATLPERIDVFRPRNALLWVLAHMVLAIVMHRSPLLATLHGVITLAWAIHVAFRGKRIENVAVVMAYITGAEVLWRSTDAYVPYESGKYMVCLLSLIAMTRYKQWRLPWLPLLYLAFLLPSVLLTLTQPIQELVKEQTAFKSLVFNMAGPLSLTLAACFFSRLRLRTVHLLNICVALVAPTLGLAALTLFAIKSGPNVSFGRTSVSVIREEFGPNQLSAAIGLGALFLFLMLLLDEHSTLRRRCIMLAGLLIMLMATALTFSRGGIYNFGGAVIVAILFVLQDTVSRLRVIGLLAVGLVLINFLVLPALNNMTGGFLVKRFTNTNLTGRDTLAWVDLEIWRENPIYGVGPGRAIDSRVRLYRRNAAHTEFTRMLSEHGTLGFVSLCVLIAIAVNCLGNCVGPRARAVTVGLLMWSFLFMTNAAMRLAAPSFAIGLACAFFECEFQKKSLQSRRLHPARRPGLRRPMSRQPALRQPALRRPVPRGARPAPTTRATMR